MRWYSAIFGITSNIIIEQQGLWTLLTCSCLHLVMLYFHMQPCNVSMFAFIAWHTLVFNQNIYVCSMLRHIYNTCIYIMYSIHTYNNEWWTMYLQLYYHISSFISYTCTWSHLIYAPGPQPAQRRWNWSPCLNATQQDARRNIQQDMSRENDDVLGFIFFSGWWFQPLWKILVNGKEIPIYYGK